MLAHEIDLEGMTVEQLIALRDRIMAAIAAQQAQPALHRISDKWGAYNERRYSRPWIAVVSAWPVGSRPVLEFGRYLGDENGGETEIMAPAGAIIRSGQRDNRGGNGSNEWAIVQADGSQMVCTESEARKHWQATH